MKNVVASGAKGITKGVAKGVKKGVKILTKEGEMSWEEIKDVEKRRRDVLKKSSLPFHRLLLAWDGTVLSALSTDPLIYLTIILYGCVRVGARVGLPEFVSDLGGADIGIIGAFLSFFLVFFVVNSNGRFNTLYNTSMGCKGRIFDAAFLAKTTLPRENALRLVRYMNAAHLAGYVGLSATYNYGNFFAELNNLNYVLTPAEVERLKRIDMDKGGPAFREIIAWCCAEIQHVQKLGLIDSRLASQFRDLVLKLAGSLGTLFNYDDQPISFFYIHFICLLSALYLPLFAISAALDAGTGNDSYWLNDVVNGLIVALQGIFVIGLRLLGQKMSDPYGDDLEDLSVMHYINFTWINSRRILEAEMPAPLNGPLEEQLCKESRSIGEAWEEQKEFIGNPDDNTISHLDVSQNQQQQLLNGGATMTLEMSDGEEKPATSTCQIQ